MEAAWETLFSCDRARIVAFPRDKAGNPYGNVLDLLSHALRGAIVAQEGYELFVADFAAIEARVLLWLAEDDEHLGIFRRHEDIYCDMASGIYGYPVTKANEKERALGKVAVLGLGYQMGWSRFIETCALMAGIEIDEDLSRQVVDTYREKYWRVKQMWADQNDAAVRAVRSSQSVVFGRVSWFTEGDYLYCHPPSGPRRASPSPGVKQRDLPGGGKAPALAFMGGDTLTRQWKRQ